MRQVLDAAFTVARRLTLQSALILVAASLASTTAVAQVWTGSVGNYWFNSANWSPSVVPNSPAANVFIAAGTGHLQTILDAPAAISTLVLYQTRSLDISGGTLTVYGGQITNIGTINVTGGGQLLLGNDLAISNLGGGQGTINLSGGQIATNGGNYTLNNGNLIYGSGSIGHVSSGGSTLSSLSLYNGSTIEANSFGAALVLEGTGTNINAGAMGATYGGILDLSTLQSVNNGSGTIYAFHGGTVNVNTEIAGGRFATSYGGTIQTSGSAFLNGTTGPNGITIFDNGTYTAPLGTTTDINGTLTLGGVSSFGDGSRLQVGGQLRLQGDTTLTVGSSFDPTRYSAPTLSMTAGSEISTTSGFILNNYINIEGAGTLGTDHGVPTDLQLNNFGTVNANVAGATLQITGTGNFVNYYGTPVAVRNAGVLSASNGGTLLLSTVLPVSNADILLAPFDGQIISTGFGSSVDINTTILGGTLTTQNGGTMRTFGSATLDGSTDQHGAITLSDGSTYTGGAGTLTSVTGTLNLGTATGSTLALGGNLQLTGDTTLNGPGSVSMQAGSGIGTDGNPFTLNVSSTTTIQGAGLIGSPLGGAASNLNLNNLGTINANDTSGTLQIGGAGTITNSGLLQATNGGTLLIGAGTTINGGYLGNISAGSAGTVNVSGVIRGGTLDSVNGSGTIQTLGTATLDGFTSGQIDFAGGTVYTAGAGTLTDVMGTLSLAPGSGIALGGQLRLIGDTDIGGSQGGVFLTSGSEIGTNGNTFTLNILPGNLVRGVGTIGSLGGVAQNLNVLNGGSILSEGGDITIAGNGVFSNNYFGYGGALVATTGTTLHLSAALDTLDYSSGQLHSGGYYEAIDGTLQIDSFGTSGGEIKSNAARIYLEGTGLIADKSNLNALSQFQDNLAGGSFSVANGQNFITSPVTGVFTNAGTVGVNPGSSFTVNGTYLQTSGQTFVDGVLTPGSPVLAGASVRGSAPPAPGLVEIAGGTLSGSGTINGNVQIDANGILAGPLNIAGALSLAGTFAEQIGGTGSGQFNFTSITGGLTLDPTSILDISLVSGYNPVGTHSYVILDALGGITGIFGHVNFLNALGASYILDYTNPDQVILNITGSPVVTPEPAVLIPLAAMMAGTVFWHSRRRQSRQPR